MALITCPECSTEISSEATSCPHCGYVNQKAVLKKKSNNIAIGCLFISILFVIIVIIGGFSSSKIDSANSTQSTYTEPALPIIDVAPGLTDEQLKASLSHLRKKVDDVEDITWYYHQNSPKYTNSRTAISVYFGYSGNTYKPRLLINYVASDWLFIEKYTIKADGESFEISPTYRGIERDNGTLSDGEVGIWEWYDSNISRREMEMVLSVIKSKKAVIRFQGKQYYKDHTISQSEKNALKEILAAWKQMGGVFR